MLLACTAHALGQLLFALPVAIPAGWLGVIKVRAAWRQRVRRQAPLSRAS